MALLSGCVENTTSEIEALMGKMQINVERAEEVDIIYSDSAVVKVRIMGPVMLSHLDQQDPKQEFPDGVEVEFFDAGGEISSTLVSKYAVRYERKGEVLVRDSVLWRSNNGETLETSELIWNEGLQLITSDKFVVITRPDEIIYGHGFEATQDFSSARINAVEGRIKVNKPEDGPTPTPSSPSNQQ